jgi:SulP family sulfate permease
MLTREVLAGIVTALALIPEAISFSVVAGVDPAVGLFSSVIIAIVISIVGGRPAMVSAAAGSVALVIAPLVRQHGIEYLVPAIVLGGVFQLLLGFLGVARLMRFIPRSVNVAFVNALAILIFTAQLPNLLGDDVPFIVWPLTALGIAIIVGFPFLTKAIPAPLIAVVVITGITMPRITQSGIAPSSDSRKSIPERYVVALQPTDRMNRCTPVQTAASSSTIATAGAMLDISES